MAELWNISSTRNLEMAGDLGPPVRVSPLIRFGRWSFLATGILYGAFHQNRLSKREVKIREVEAKEKVIRDARIAEEKARTNIAEMKSLEDIMSSKK